MNIHRVFASLFLSLLLIGCTGTPSISQRSSTNIPRWVDEPYAQFDKDEYLVAVGSGSSHQRAQDNALSNLARIFSADITMSQQLYNEIKERSGGQDEGLTERSELYTQSTIKSKQALLNTKILEQFDAKNGTVYALAAIDRKETARIYRKEMSANEEQLQGLESRFEASEDPIQRLSLISKAVTFAKLNRSLDAQRSIISGGSSDAFVVETLTRVTQKLEEQQAETGVFVGSVPNHDAIQEVIITQLRQSGFTVVQDRSKALLEVQPVFDVQTVDLNRDDAIFVKWMLTISTKSLYNSETYASFSAEGRDGDPTEKGARVRAEFSARKELQKKYLSFITKELFK